MAVVLSALVVPGLGQVYLGRRILGAVLILAAAAGLVALIAATAVAASHMDLSAVVDPDQARQLLPQLYQHAPWGYRLAIGVLGLSWLVAVADTLRPPGTGG